MNALVAYQFDEEPVRVIMIAGEPWFVANDVAKVLGYKHAPHMVRMLEDDERGIHIVDTPSAPQEMNVISESGLYAVILKSRREEAKRFRKWVTAEVLPSIRHTGKFEMPGYEPPPTLAHDAEPVRIQAEMSLIREARQLWGRQAARDIWIARGLPSPIARAEGKFQGDEWAAEVFTYIASRHEVTTEQVARALNVPWVDDLPARRRIRALLDMRGWTEHNYRRDGSQAKWWSAPHAGEA